MDLNTSPTTAYFLFLFFFPCIDDLMCAFIDFTLSTLRERTEPEAPVSVADKGAFCSPALESPSFYQLPSSSSQAERLPTLQGV